MLTSRGNVRGITTRLSIYIDDIELSMSGRRLALARELTWGSELLMDWVTKSLGKSVAKDKLLCVASASSLRDALRRTLGPRGFKVECEGELLGTDFAAGGRVSRRKAQRARTKKAWKRRGRIQWWREIGGRAAEVARGGAKTSIQYGATATGLPPRFLLTARRIQGAAARIQAGGASLTAKLALGGEHYEERDPAVTDPNPPLRALMGMIWDRPQLRADFVSCWKAAAVDFGQCSEAAAWKLVRGPLSAAWAHLKRIDAKWTAPFRIQLMSHNVDLLMTPDPGDGDHASTRQAAFGQRSRDAALH